MSRRGVMIMGLGCQYSNITNGLRHTMTSFGHIFCFVCSMDMLEPMRPLILPLPSAFESELFCWANHWKRQETAPDEFVATIIASHAAGIFCSPIYVSCLRFWLSYLLEAPSPKGHSPVSADSTSG